MELVRAGEVEKLEAGDLEIYHWADARSCCEDY